MGWRQAEQLCTLSEYRCSCSLSTVQLSGASLASVEVSLTLLGKFEIDTQTEKQTDSGVCRVASATNNLILFLATHSPPQICAWELKVYYKMCLTNT